MDRHGAYPRERYEELEPLDRRGRAVLVRDRENGQLYVKKQLVTHAPEVYRQLLREPVEGMPVLLGVWPQGEELVTIEEYLPGRTLAEILAEDGPFNEYETLCIGIALCGILKALHSRRPAIIHRDIKPGNILRQPDGRIVLLDLSAAKSENPHQSRDTVLIGTAGFAAPEQYGFSASTVQTDIYSLGVLLNTLRTGALPSERRAGGQLRRIIDRCLQLYPKDRYPGVEDLARALKAAKFERIPWLPPGFRTQCWYKAIPATFYYIFIYAFCFVEYRTPDHPLYQPLSDRLQWAAIALFPVAFYCNYLGIQRLFPLMKSRNRLLRFLGLLIGPLWAVAVSAIAAVMLSPF
jgi:serine/threonine protein kinase